MLRNISVEPLLGVPERRPDAAALLCRGPGALRAPATPRPVRRRALAAAVSRARAAVPRAAASGLGEPAPTWWAPRWRAPGSPVGPVGSPTRPGCGTALCHDHASPATRTP